MSTGQTRRTWQEQRRAQGLCADCPRVTHWTHAYGRTRRLVSSDARVAEAVCDSCDRLKIRVTELESEIGRLKALQTRGIRLRG